MTLLEIANYVCGLLNQTDAEDIAAAKTFAKSRFNLIWADQLWKDSIFEYTQTLGAAEDYVVTDTWLPTKKILLLPTQISHVLAVRSQTWRWDVADQPALYRTDYNIFESTGKEAAFRLLPQCVWEFETPQSFGPRAISPDQGQVATAHVMDSDGSAVVSKLSVVMSGTMGTAVRIDTFGKPVGQGDVTLIVVHDTFTTVPASRTSAQKRQRIQLFGNVPDQTVIRVLGKVHCPAFEDDNDEPCLTGVESALLAFVHAEMLKRERQYAKAAQQLQEAVQILDQLKREQVVQQVNRQQIIPEDGYGAIILQGTGFIGDFAKGDVGILTSPPASTVIDRVSGTMRLLQGTSEGFLSFYTPFQPTSVRLWVTTPPGGLIISAVDQGGSLSSNGVYFLMTGITTSNDYILNYEVLA